MIDEMDRREIAEVCNVTVQAISNWIHKRNNHPSDETSGTLLKLVLDKKPQKVEEIIRTDIERYFEELKEIGITISQVNGNLVVRQK
ncbi:hypothetical protein AKJ39_04920 [candidate division MSBL1 archaeon SCGC-AAA259J03]|uniref:Uncharacterized protein n=1 Tax=candidate division MSBL1 archaeon SCGC-AAA259J03 TaxID=1698269 RepID=A0A656YV38_9EURY|nr:hypothetical protein AKJ39_04920 [candidate division MSBL1 archaeon SCGC-AAA259J03]